MSKQKHAILTIVAANANKSIRLTTQPVIFGRDKADIILEDQEISATHFQVQSVGEDYIIFDMNSKNGTFVNMQKITKKILAHQDEIKAGNTRIVFTFEEAETVLNIPSATQIKESEHSQIYKQTAVNKYFVDSTEDKSIYQLNLKITLPDQTSELFQTQLNPFYLGRDSQIKGMSRDPEVSRKHIKFFFNDEKSLFVEDLDSANGTFVNGVKIRGTCQLSEGDWVKIGSCTIIANLVLPSS